MTTITKTIAVTARHVPVPAPALTWTEFPGTNFRDRVKALIPPGAYLGSNPIGAIVDAFSDPTPDAANRGIYFFGGGHNDGTCNAVVRFDTTDLTYSIAIPATPPAMYPPIYGTRNAAGGSGPLTYPSGLQPGYFSSTLTDPRDTPYNAPQDAPSSSHMYAAGAMRGDTISYFYGPYKQANIATGKWEHLADVDIGKQLSAFNPNYQLGPLGQGTVAAYDPVTDQFIVSLVPGDMGYKWRMGFFRFNPMTRTIVPGSIVIVVGGIRSAMNLLMAGRHVYGLCARLADQSYGWRYNMDTNVLQHLRIEGDLFTFVPTNQAETVPASYHSGRNTILRWNYTTQINSLYEVDLTPVSGAGSLADPLVLKQTRLAIAGVPPPAPILNYRRLFFNAGTGQVLFLPRADSNWYGVRM